VERVIEHFLAILALVIANDLTKGLAYLLVSYKLHANIIALAFIHKKKMRGICVFVSDFLFSLLYGLLLLFFCGFGHYFGLKLLLSRFLFKFIAG